ncbi:MAG TPA: dTDP-4-dehydrorhamnose 3,5-epimerase family protein [Acidimicrobiia bacterium]|nr:dTDP-4-dehydrorhamnose 3,5-epimerase family protein [Acidimicrobiia bacterium]
MLPSAITVIVKRVFDPSRLPDGVQLVPLDPHDDHRGRFVEMFRQEWNTGLEPIQWNYVRSAANVLRGVHLHPRHGDYLTVVMGRAQVGLRDLRKGSPTEDLATTFEMHEAEPVALVIPPGVAHGFWFAEPSLHVYSVTHYFDLDDELACRWNDPELELRWEPVDPILSDRDASSGSLREMIDFVNATV